MITKSEARKALEELLGSNHNESHCRDWSAAELCTKCQDARSAAFAILETLVERLPDDHEVMAHITAHGDRSVGIFDVHFTAGPFIKDDDEIEMANIRGALHNAFADICGQDVEVQFDDEIRLSIEAERMLFDPEIRVEGVDPA